MTTRLVYCYHCCAQHPKEQMRLVVSKTGSRWRCKISIDAAAKADKDLSLRNAYGQKAAEKNKIARELSRQAKQNAPEFNYLD